MERDELKKLIERSDLQDIWLRSGSCSCMSPPSMIEQKNVDISYNFKIAHSLDKKNKWFVGFIVLELSGKSKKGGENLFEFENSFALVYSLKGKGETSPDTIKDFLNTTAIFSAYPHHRELIQSQSVRMGLFPIVLPLFKPSLAKPDPKNKTPSKKKRT